MAAGDAERRRLERNLHDGAQQRLVALALQLRLIQADIRRDPSSAEAMITSAGDELAQSLGELRELARGIHPAVLEHGLASALNSLAARSTVPTAVTCDVTERLPQQIALAMYFVACEALANVAKYAQATAASVSVARTERGVAIEIADDGVGGADAGGGSGLRGLADRVEALGGHLLVTSPPGAGTVVIADLPMRVLQRRVDGLVAVASGQPSSHGPTITAAALMGTREAYAPGVFCWVDLATSDVDGAKAFYKNLFGWEYDDRDAGDGQTYAMASRDGHVVAGMMAAADPGPPRWQSYIAVVSADDAAAKAASAGAQVLMAPANVGPRAARPCWKTPRARPSSSGKRASVRAPHSSTRRARCAGTTCSPTT